MTSKILSPQLVLSPFNYPPERTRNVIPVTAVCGIMQVVVVVHNLPLHTSLNCVDIIRPIMPHASLFFSFFFFFFQVREEFLNSRNIFRPCGAVQTLRETKNHALGHDVFLPSPLEIDLQPSAMSECDNKTHGPVR